MRDFKASDVVPTNELEAVDQYMLVQMNKVIAHILDSYEKYDFLEATSSAVTYMTSLLSAFYLDFTKDILYIEKADSKRRRQVQTVLYYHLKNFMRALSPVLVFTTEELHDHFHCDEHKAESIFLEAQPELVEVENAEALETLFAHFMSVRDDVLKALEVARNEKIIGKSLEAKVTLALKDECQEDRKSVV